MRKLIVGLIAVAFLAAAAPAKAQTADPLGLIASGAVIPYVGTTGIAVVTSSTGALSSTFQAVGSLAILDAASPVGAADPFHMFFYDQTCARVGPSVGNPMTVNDADLLNLSLIPNIAQTGLIAAASTNSAGAILTPLNSPVHLKVFWINAVDGVLSRVLEPISIHNPEAGDAVEPNIWNPLRTGATFVAPLEGSGVHTTLYLVCPTQQIIPGAFPSAGGAPPFTATTDADISAFSGTIPTTANPAAFAPSGQAFLCTSETSCTDVFAYTGLDEDGFNGVTGVGTVYPAGTLISPVPVGGAFPALNPTPVAAGGITPLFGRVYNDEENFLRDITVNCRCWGAHPVADLDPVYSNAVEAPRGTYTELEGRSTGACSNPDGSTANCSFTGYRAIRWGSGVVGNDVFGRLSNANRLSDQGTLTQAR